jgi:protein tyrosine phosphatase (PTP) superfamily phosphohydrolase (DUF442 family)
MDASLTFRHPLNAGPARRLSVGSALRVWLSTLLVDHAIFRLFFNTRYRVTDRLYRSSHPLPFQLRVAAAAGIRTVINLRGNCPRISSNQLEWNACERYGLKIFHFPLRSRDAPRRDELLGLSALFKQCADPVLMHCKSGADRAGIASAVFLLTQEHCRPDQARRQLSFWRFGHVRWAKTGILDHFLDAYAQAYAASGIGFIDWVSTEYDRDAVLRSFRSRRWANWLVDRVLNRE